MRPIVIFARLQIEPSSHDAAETYYKHLVPVLGSVKGFEGAALWQSVGKPTEHIALYHYASREAADEGLMVVAQKRFLAEAIPTYMAPPDVVRVAVHGRQGESVAGAELGSYLSVSIRVADPGMGGELVSELDRIFQEIAVIPGFNGAEFGPNDTLAEEIVGFATWDTPEDFAMSLPAGALYEVKLFKRIV